MYTCKWPRCETAAVLWWLIDVIHGYRQEVVKSIASETTQKDKTTSVPEAPSHRKDEKDASEEPPPTSSTADRKPGTKVRGRSDGAGVLLRSDSRVGCDKTTYDERLHKWRSDCITSKRKRRRCERASKTSYVAKVVCASLYQKVLGEKVVLLGDTSTCLLYTSPSPRD